jgi:Protein of unknwon function (DUF3310)
MYIHFRDPPMKQEKLCESEDMTEKDYSRWYLDPTEEKRFTEELGAENAKYDPRVLTSEHLERIQQAAMERIGVAMKEWEKANQKPQSHKLPEEAPPQAYQIGGTHYLDMPIQPWDVVDKGPKEQAVGFYRYNALKYIMRAGEKGLAKEDYQKALHYLEKLLEIL